KKPLFTTTKRCQNVDNNSRNIMGGEIYLDPKEEESLLSASNYNHSYPSGSLPLICNSTSNTRPHISRLNTYPPISKSSVMLESCPSSESQPISTIASLNFPNFQDNSMPNYIPIAQNISGNRSEGINSGSKSYNHLVNGSENRNSRNEQPNSCDPGNDSYDYDLRDESGGYNESVDYNLEDGLEDYGSNGHNLVNETEYYAAPKDYDTGNGHENFDPENKFYDINGCNFGNAVENSNSLSEYDDHNSRCVFEDYNPRDAFAGHNLELSPEGHNLNIGPTILILNPDPEVISFVLSRSRSNIRSNIGLNIIVIS
ncbi:24796_t:CDS:1, partial [Racocetra persica]